MKKNVAGQFVGAQQNSKTDGSAVTSGTTTVYVTGDNGTQAVGSVGSGACTHEGNGWWSYAPAQAETNYDHVVFTLVNTAAVIASVQIYPSFPQTGDNFARIGAPAGASVSADIAALKAETVTILAGTNDLQARTPAALISGRMDVSVGAMAANVLTNSAINADAFTASKFAADVTTEFQAGVKNIVDLLLLDTENIVRVTDKLETGLVVDGAVYQLTANALELAPAAPSAATIASTVWSTAIEGSRTAIQILRGFAAIMLGKTSGMSTTTNTFRDIDDTKDRAVVTVDGNENRTAVTLDLT